MKFGQKFRSESVPQWASFNVDYDELKKLIRIHTTKSQIRAIAIPGQKDTYLERFEDQYYCELINQHDRVDLFVKSKVGELNRRLHSLEKQIFRLLSKISETHSEKIISPQRQVKLARYDGQLERCGDDIKCLQRFIAAQRMAFHKILKKYTKWTGSRALAERFTDDVLASPKSFTRRDFEPLISLYTNILTQLRAAVPDSIKELVSKSPLPNSQSSNAETLSELDPPRTYWNEYDNGSEAEDNEPYLVYIDPDLEPFPGVKTLIYIFSKAKMPVEKVKEWFNFTPSPGERQPLLGYAHNIREHQCMIDSDIDEAYAPSLDFSTGHATYCADVQSAVDLELSTHRESLLFRTMLGSFSASFVLLLVVGMLAFTGKKKLRVEVDAGVIVGVIASLFFATVGFCLMRCRREKLAWPHRISVALTYVIACVLNCLILVEVSENK